MRILLIEDDKRLARLIGTVLKEEGFAFDVTHDGAVGLEIALRGVHDVAIIDWMLPGKDGPSIIRAVRAAKIPLAILMLTARTQIEDRVTGLDSGTDDYLVKPFAFEELSARVRALTKRFFNENGSYGELRVGQIVMDTQAHSTRRGEQLIELTKTEWDLLEYFMRHPGQTLTRQNILDYVWSYEKQVKPEMVDVYISYLRQKLNRPKMADPIKTIRGIGYKLDPKHA